jgi:hypothetical protein
MIDDRRGRRGKVVVSGQWSVVSGQWSVVVVVVVVRRRRTSGRRHSETSPGGGGRGESFSSTATHTPSLCLFYFSCRISFAPLFFFSVFFPFLASPTLSRSSLRLLVVDPGSTVTGLYSCGGPHPGARGARVQVKSTSNSRRSRRRAREKGAWPVVRGWVVVVVEGEWQWQWSSSSSSL